MIIQDITAKVGQHKKRKRVGRGIGSGHGKTAGRGHKGAGSRSGFSGSIRASREGGQMPFFRRIPKRGFSNFLFRKEYKIVNLQALAARFDDGAEITPETLKQVGLIGDTRTPVKILGQGELSKKFKVTAATFSAGARAKIEKAGGAATATEPPRPPKRKPAPPPPPPAKAEKPEKGAKGAKAEKGEKGGKPEKGEKPEKIAKAEKTPKPDKAPKAEEPDKPEKSEKSDEA